MSLSSIDVFGGICSRMLPVVADSIAKGALLLAIAAGVALLLRHRSAALRHLVWLMALAALLVGPVCSVIAPGWQVPFLPARTSAASAEASVVPDTPTPAARIPRATAVETPAAFQPISSDIQSAPVSATPSRIAYAVEPVVTQKIVGTIHYERWIVFAWLMGVACVLGQLLIGMVIVAHRRRRALPLERRLGGVLASVCASSSRLDYRRVRLLVSEDSRMPMATGILRPAVLLPAEAREWTPDKLRAVLLHELAHVRRFDCLTQALAHIAVALHWCNPLAWFAVRRLTIEREQACDDAVLAAGVIPSGYAGHLLEVVRTLRAGGLLTKAATVPMARRSQLERRLLGILDAARPRQPVTRRAFVIAFLVAVVAALPLAALRIGRAQPTASPAAATEGSLYTPLDPNRPAVTSDIRGVVRDESGRAVAGMTVQAIHGSERNFERRTAITDAAGGFIFSRLQPEGYWSFSVNNPRYALEGENEHAMKVPADAVSLPIEITLYRPRTLRGVVVADDGKPVANVRVVLVEEQLLNPIWPISDHNDVGFLVTQTDAAGHFVMPRLRPGRAVLALEHPDFAIKLVATQVDGKEPTFTIQRGLTLRGRVVHDGHPVPGVSLAGGRKEGHRPMLDWQGKSDADGRFEISHIPPVLPPDTSILPALTVEAQDSAWNSSVYDVYQSADGGLPAVTIDVTPHKQGQSPIRQSVDVGKSSPPQSGTVIVTLPGEITQTDVFLDTQTQSAISHTVTFTGVPAGRQFVSATSSVGAPGRPPVAIDVTAGKTITVNMPPGPSGIRGTIRSAGKPVGGRDGYLSWFAYPPGSGGSFQGGSAVTTDGTYAIRGLAPGEYLLVYESVNSMASDNSMGNKFLVSVGNDALMTHDLDLPTGRIEGRIAGFVPPPKSHDNPMGSIEVWPRGFPRQITTDGNCTLDPGPDGRFTVEHLSPGWYTVVGYGLTDTVHIDHPGASATATLQPPKETGEIDGTVTGRLPPTIGSDPSKPIYVNAFIKDSQGYNFHLWHQTTLNAKSGRYRLANLPVGTYGIWVASPVPPGEAPADTWVPNIEVRNGMSRELPIVVPEGRLVEIITVSYQDAISRQHRSIPTCTGWRLQMPSGDWVDGPVFGITFSLPLGQYTIEAQYGFDRAIVRQSFTVDRGQGTEKILLNAPTPPTTPNRGL